MASPIEDTDWVPADASDFNEENILPQPPDVLAKIRTWLQPTEYSNEGGEFKKHLASHLPGTGDWLFSSDAYRQWHRGSSPDRGLLWIRGIPGSGKSVFAASIVDQLRQEQCPVLYFFFRQIIDANHSPMAALRDWLHQLLVFSPPLQAVLKDYVDEKGNRRDLESLSSADLWRHLRDATIYIPKVYIVVDALDEMDQTKDLEPFLQSLAALAGWRPSQVKVVATSRPVAYVEKTLRTANAFHIRLEERQVDIDIATYVKHKLSLSTISTEMQAHIRAAVPGRANGLFLYAKLAMNAFLRPGADVAHVLDQLPQDLNVMYTDLLREHSRRSGVPDDIQLLILQSVTHASRPLRLLEIAEFIDVTQHPLEERDLKAAKDLVRSACGPLLEILPDETVSVVHHSLTEFLNGSTRQFTPGSYPVLEPGPTHCRLALVCLAYLLSGCMDNVDLKEQGHSWQSSGVYNSVHLMYPFLQYASRNWHIHARKSTLSGYEPSEMNALTAELLTGGRMQKWAALLEGAHGISNGESLTPLIVAVRFGLVEYVKVLLGQPKTDLNKAGPMGSPLCVAAREGFDDIVDLLLKSGANNSANIDRGNTPLLLAAGNNHPKVARILVDAGVDPFKELRIESDSIDRTIFMKSPISVACQNGHTEVITEFFSRIKKDEEANRLLTLAVANGRPEIVELALRHPLVNVNAQDRSGYTALFIACNWRRAKIIRLLLQAGAHPNISLITGAYSRGQDTPLHALVHAGHRGEEISPEETMECFELLLAAGANASHLDGDGNTVLHHVGDAVTARLLLDAGADPNASNNDGETLLHTCKDENVLRVLLEDAKADLERKTEKSGLTPLLSAMRSNRISIALLLLELGASSHAVEDETGDGAFHFAVRIWGKSPVEFQRIPDVIQRLHECGGDSRARNHAGDTPLHVLFDHSNIQRDTIECIFQALLKTGADLEARDRMGRTVFFRLAASTHSYSDLAWGMLLRAGARPDTVDCQGRTLFYYNDHYNGPIQEEREFAEYMKHGLDPKQTDIAGNTLWHSRIPRLAGLRQSGRKKGEHPEKVQVLIKLGIDPLQPNHAGRTALHQMCTYSHNQGYREWDIRDESYGMAPDTQRNETMLEYMLSQYSIHGLGVDQTDKDGATALHLASTHCEFTTRLLLEAGADPLKTTLEGLNPLHLAARSRRPNVIAVLLSWLREESRYTAEQQLRAVNASAKSYHPNRTPLRLACASGQPISVRLLLEAGASDALDKNWRSDWDWSDSAWSACSTFEEEDILWQKGSGHEYGRAHDNSRPSAQSVLLIDTDRHKTQERDRYFPAARLEEIIDLLSTYQPPTLQTITSVTGRAADRNFDYTTECLARKRKALFPEADNFINLHASLSLARRKANREAISRHAAEKLGGIPWKYGHGSHWPFSASMHLRDYAFAAEMLPQPGGLGATEADRAILHDLVVSGNALVLKKVATKEIIAKLEDWEVRLQAPDPQNSSDAPDKNEPLLLLACKAETPNMDVIRALVEDIGVDLNVRSMSKAMSLRFQKIEDQTAIHLLVGGTHWWQSALALPYLIEKGADLEARDGAGLTPLLAALGQIPRPGFDPRVVELLVANGADVNAVDAKGRSCLARAVADRSMVMLLLRSGATVTSSAFNAAIRGLIPDILKAILTHGADPNVRQTPEEQQHVEDLASNAPLISQHRAPKGTELGDDDLYPVDFVTRASGNSRGDNVTAKTDMIRILLNHGADPNAAYPDTTVMHRVIQNGHFVGMFLSLPSLSLEARDAEGHTLLHTACITGIKEDNIPGNTAGLLHPADILLDRGADMHALSTDGSNTLHHLIPNSPTGRVISIRSHHRPTTEALIRRIAVAAPNLLNLRNTSGHTPLHKALLNSGWQTESRNRLLLASTLLSLGADPHLPDPTGNTPLHLLLSCQWLISPTNELTCPVAALFTQLLAAGADINSLNSAGETPIFSFFRRGYVSFAQSHFSRKGDSNKSTTPPTPSDAALWSLFDTAGVDWKATSALGGESLLHVVAGRYHTNNVFAGDGEVKYFRKLMERGLDPLAEDGRQRTALDVAAVVGAEGILGMFKKGRGEGGGGDGDGDGKEDGEEEEGEEDGGEGWGGW